MYDLIAEVISDALDSFKINRIYDQVQDRGEEIPDYQVRVILRFLLQPRIHRLTFHREHTKHALVDPPERLSAYKALQRLNPQRELTQCQRSLVFEAAFPKPVEMLGREVLWTINNAEVLGAAALHRRLEQPSPPSRNELPRLDHHPLAAARSHGLPPIDRILGTRLVGEID